jgi:signal transduction histidine kinase
MANVAERQAELVSPDLRALSDLAAAVAQRSDEIEEFLGRICTTLARSFGFDRVVMHRYYEATNEIAPLVAHGREHFARDYAYPIEEEPLVKRALDAGRPIYVRDVRAEAALSEEVLQDYEPSSVVSAPLLVEGHCLGFMSADRGGRLFEFGAEALRILEVFTAITAVFLEKALEQRELERLNELKSQFVALASHELRTPATSIYGAAVTLHERAHELEQEQLESLRDILFEQSDRLRVLVEELLDLSRLDAGSIRIQPERIEVATRLHRLVEELFAEWVRDLRIQVEAGLDARADPSAFDRIVSNLLANAFRYGEPPVTIEVAQGDSGVRVSVEDRGPGVPPEFVPRLFERFTRAQPSGDGAGTGLGLSIAQALAQAHGAEISYRPAHPHGARFELELPAAPAD